MATLRDGRSTLDYPIKIVVRLNRKQMVAIRAVCDLYGSPEAFCYSVIVNGLRERWGQLSEETKQKIVDTPYRVTKRKQRK